MEIKLNKSRDKQRHLKLGGMLYKWSISSPEIDFLGLREYKVTPEQLEWIKENMS